MGALEVPSAPVPLVAVVGPTASGKSALAVRIALTYEGEVLNFDSVQVYRGFDVGSGKLPLAERHGVPHHLTDLAGPEETFTSGDYRREGLRVLDAVRRRGHLPVLAGGSGLYLRALLLGLFEGPPRSQELRRRLSDLAGRRGREFLHRVLARLDPASARRMHPRDTQKIIRALEVCLLTRRPLSDLLGGGRVGLGGFRVLKVGLNPARAELVERINARVERMFTAGLVDEVRAALQGGAGASAPLGALGYRQARAFVEGAASRDEAVRGTQSATRQYAKRQMTWFRREPGVKWFEGFGDDPSIQGQVLDWLGRMLPGRGSESSILESGT
ncbi:MAG TPA: tRNA (adenosine(37)-N6)-dimethylallyltransferase MiaA [Terriglobia bacterium]|nr:tRNA (adenosine(37)-N6)-dimethylallyltransferase MiaA [Terriglobia bacterium]